MKQSNNSRIAIKDILSVIGLAAFALLTYLGQLYINGGNQSPSILWTVVFTVIAAALVFGAAFIKGSKIDAKLMLIVQIVMLIIYVAFAALTSKGILKFFHVQAEKEHLTQFAQQDLNAIDSLFSNYLNAETDFINKTKTGYILALESGTQCSMEVTQTMNRLGVTAERLDIVIEEQRKHVKDDFVIKKNEITNEFIKPCKQAIATWSYFDVPLLTQKLNRTSANVLATVNYYTDRATLPVIEKVDGICQLKEEKQLFIQTAPALHFGEEVSKEPTITPIAIIVLILVHVLILFTYIMKPAEVVYHGGSGSNKDGGVEL